MFLILICWSLLLLEGYCQVGWRRWDYEPLSIVPFTSDRSKLKLDLRVQRIRRGEFAVSGSLDFNYDTDNTTMIETRGYISESGSDDDYIQLPYSIQKQSLHYGYHKFYQELITMAIGKCSNLPKYNPRFKSPFPRKLYTFDRCVNTGDGLPNILQDGYYKIVVNFTGEVNWGFTGIGKVVRKKFF